jgi:hypothetical protein
MASQPRRPQLKTSKEEIQTLEETLDNLITYDLFVAAL